MLPRSPPSFDTMALISIFATADEMDAEKERQILISHREFRRNKCCIAFKSPPPPQEPRPPSASSGSRFLPSFPAGSFTMFACHSNRKPLFAKKRGDGERQIEKRTVRKVFPKKVSLKSPRNIPCPPQKQIHLPLKNLEQTKFRSAPASPLCVEFWWPRPP